jgi:hypothetical protein
VVHQGELTIAITSRVGTRKSDDAPNGPTSIDVKHCHLIDLDHDPPSDEVWFEQKYTQMLADPDRPRGIGNASRWMHAKMCEAVRRYQVKNLWAMGTIEKKLSKRGWKRTRPLKRIAGSNAKHTKPQMQGHKLLKIEGTPTLAIFELRDGQYWDGRMNNDTATPMPDGFYVYELTGDGCTAQPPSSVGSGVGNGFLGPYASVKEAEREARKSMAKTNEPKDAQ